MDDFIYLLRIILLALFILGVASVLLWGFLQFMREKEH